MFSLCLRAERILLTQTLMEFFDIFRMRRGWLTVSNFPLDPTANNVENLAAIRLEHHEMAITQNAAIFQLERLRGAASLLKVLQYRQRVPSRGLCNHIDDRD